MPWLESVREKISVCSAHYWSYTLENVKRALFHGRASYLSLCFPFSLLKQIFPIESDVVIPYGLYHLNYWNKRRSSYLGRPYYYEYNTSKNLTKRYEKLCGTYWEPDTPNRIHVSHNQSICDILWKDFKKNEFIKLTYKLHQSLIFYN